MRDVPGQLGLFGELPPPRSKTISAAPVPQSLEELAQTLPAHAALGTSSWSFPGWAGHVYAERASESRLAQQGLAAYARHPLFGAVGLDRTYYAPVAAADLKPYGAAVPGNFRFIAKAHELLTMPRFPQQPRYGSMQGQENPEFLKSDYAVEQVVGPLKEGLGDKLALILFQFPPQDARDPADFARRLHEFLDELPPGPYAVELRNARLLSPAYSLVMRRLNAVHTLNVHPGMPDLLTQASRIEPTETILIRWMLGGGQKYTEAVERYHPFDRLVDEDPATRGQIVELIRRYPGHQIYVIVNNKAEGCAPLSLVKLAEALRS